MTSKEKAERLASDAAAEMPGYVETGGEVYRFDNSDAANKISEICCLTEFFDVVEAINVLYGEISVHGGHGTPTFGDRAVCYSALNDFEIALSNLKQKLPKGMM